MDKNMLSTDRFAISRRGFIGGAAALGVALNGCSDIAHETTNNNVNNASNASNASNGNNASDEAFWAQIARDFDVYPDVNNLENGYWGRMSRPVLEQYLEHTRMVNTQNSYYARRAYKDDYQKVVAKVAASVGAEPSEIVITRGATEALQGLIRGYNRLQPGDSVMMVDLDYYSMRAEMRALAAQNQCQVVDLAVPEPVTYDGLLAFYEQALTNNPQVRLLLLTHIGHRTGLMMPIKQITEMARKLGVDVIADVAHSFGQVDIKIDDIGAGFIGFNLHKWVGAPIGAGVMYIKKQRLQDISPNPSAEGHELDTTAGRVHTGTVNFATVLTLPAAFEYHDQVGGLQIEHRLRYLRSLWVSGLKDLEAVQVLTPEDDRLHAGITSFRLRGRTSVADNKAIVEQLLADHNIFTTHRSGVAKGACVRVTPAIYNSADDIAKLTQALRKLATG